MSKLVSVLWTFSINKQVEERNYIKQGPQLSIWDRTKLHQYTVWNELELWQIIQEHDYILWD